MSADVQAPAVVPKEGNQHNGLSAAIVPKDGNQHNGLSAEKFREQLQNTLYQRKFIIPSFSIYGGVAGLYDYGPPGCAIKQNVLAFWRKENMLEVDCPSVTPEIVLKASGHVDKFTDLMVKDVVTGDCYRADHLVKEDISLKLAQDATLDEATVKDLKHTLAVLDDLNADQLGAKLKELGIKSPNKNALSDPYPFNLMFATSIGPAGNAPGYLRPETAQGIFVNFKHLYYYNGNKLPFAAAQIGQAFRNEIAPRQGLLRVREFVLAEIEHFVDPDDKSHPKFAEVADLEFLLYPRFEQTNGKDSVKTRLGDAVSKGTINNETLGYYIGRVYLFLSTLGIHIDRLRFRQHLQNEMAHYAADCWDAEIHCSYGWIECVGLADRSAYDLKAHADKSKEKLTAYEKYDTPREIEVVKIEPDRKEIGKTFKKEHPLVLQALEALSNEERLDLKAKLDLEGEVPLRVCTVDKSFTITKKMVSIKQEQEVESGRSFIPSVIEPSFGIGRIIYCLFEHSFDTRPSKGGEEDLTFFRFSPLVAPIKCTVFPLIQNGQLVGRADRIAQELTYAGVANKIDTTGTSIGKRYARTDEIGVPFAITVDFEPGTVTLRERDSKSQVRIPDDKVAEIVRNIADDRLTWSQLQSQYPAVAIVES